jgi:hypothetical protein
MFCRFLPQRTWRPIQSAGRFRKAPERNLEAQKGGGSAGLNGLRGDPPSAIHVNYRHELRFFRKILVCSYSACCWSQPSASWRACPGYPRLQRFRTGPTWGGPQQSSVGAKLSPLPRSRTFDATNHVDSRDKPGHNALKLARGSLITPIPTTNSKRDKSHWFALYRTPHRTAEAGLLTTPQKFRTPPARPCHDGWRSRPGSLLTPFRAPLRSPRPPLRRE